MNRNIYRNRLCPCGSKKKFKNCCKKDPNVDLGMLEFYGKFRAGKLPFRAEIHSDGTTESSMKVMNASVTIDGETKEVFNDEINLTVNSVKGDTKGQSTAQLSIPIKETESSSIKLTGNANITNNSSFKNIVLKDNKKKISTKSMDNNLFATLRCVQQRNSDFYYFDVLFGEKNKKEKKENGQKDRPHIAFYPDGNGKYIRLNSYKCKISSKLTYNAEKKEIYPSTVKIELEDYNLSLQIEFTYDYNEENIILNNAYFI